MQDVGDWSSSSVDVVGNSALMLRCKVIGAGVIRYLLCARCKTQVISVNPHKGATRKKLLPSFYRDKLRLGEGN